jgi:hypothetical protein
MLALPGCSSYTLRGKVVQGDTNSIELVHEIDQRLKQPGLSNVETLVRRDSKQTKPAAPELAGRVRTDATGDFWMPIDEYGAGWMQEQWLVQARLSGYQNASCKIKLPAKGSKWKLLITLAPGTSTPLIQPGEVIEEEEVPLQ